jgi:Mn-dependent DtxR family transcriptional regulator
MAEYLNVDRSALSRELSNMKKEGLIDYRKNRFIIL